MRLDDLEKKTEQMSLQHDSFANNTRTQLKQVFEAIRQLMAPTESPKRPIGFVVPAENASGSKSPAGNYHST